MQSLKLRTFIILALLPCLSWARPFSLTQYSPRAQVIDGVSFPRVGIVTYRGVEPKLYSFKDSVEAIFGNSEKNIESIMMSAIKFKLMGKLDEDERSYVKRKTRGDWWRRGDDGEKIRDTIDNHIASNGGPLTESQAIPIAKSLLNQSYHHQFREDQLGSSYRTVSERVLNYRSENYSDFPRDVVFSSVYQRTASIYGAGIIVIQEDPAIHRSLDMTYWNFIHNSFWKGGADAGEMIFPGYIEAKEVIGYELHTRGNYGDKTKGGVSISEYGVQKHEPIDIAIYKHTLDGETYILVFDGIDKDGDKRNCLRKGSDHKYYFCYRNDSVASTNPLPKLSNTEANLMGVIKLCSDPDTCQSPDKVFSQFQYYSQRDLPVLDQYRNGLGHGNIASIIQTIKVNGKQAKFFKAPL